VLKSAPHETPYGRMDEVRAAKALVLCCVTAYAQKEPVEMEVGDREKTSSPTQPL